MLAYLQIPTWTGCMSRFLGTINKSTLGSHAQPRLHFTRLYLQQNYTLCQQQQCALCCNRLLAIGSQETVEIQLCAILTVFVLCSIVACYSKNIVVLQTIISVLCLVWYHVLDWLTYRMSIINTSELYWLNRVMFFCYNVLFDYHHYNVVILLCPLT